METAAAENSGMENRRDLAGMLKKPWVCVLTIGCTGVSVEIWGGVGGREWETVSPVSLSRWV